MNYLTNQQYRSQKAALTRAVNSKDPAKVERTVRQTVAIWEGGGYAWPDDWHRWQRALDDATPWPQARLDITRL